MARGRERDRDREQRPQTLDQVLESIPRHDEAAEQGVLGCMLSDERAASVAVELLVEQDFYLPRHQLLFTLFKELHQQQPDLDLLYVGSELDRRGLTERVGGKDVPGRLLEATPNPGNVERYCRIVRERATERKLIEAAVRIIEGCKSPTPDEDAQALLNRAEALIYNIADERGGQDVSSMHDLLEHVLSEAQKHVDARARNEEIPLPCIATGFGEIDNLLAGGLWPGEVIIVAARPSVGKTTFAINVARKMAVKPPERNPVPVAIFSLEMPAEQISKNILCAEARISSAKMRRYQFDEQEFENVRFVAGNLQRAPIYVDDAKGLTPSELRARARRLCHRQGVRMFVVDYLQLMTSDRRSDSREQEVAELSRNVKALARELNVPIILLSQLKRPPAGSENKKPQLSDLRESGSIEQDADVVIMLHRELEAETGLRTTDTTAIVQKNRNGETGDVRLTFFPHELRFETFAPDAITAGMPAGVQL